MALIFYKQSLGEHPSSMELVQTHRIITETVYFVKGVNVKKGSKTSGLSHIFRCQEVKITTTLLP